MDPRNLPAMPELMIVGPGELHEEDLAVLGGQVIAHYGDVWVEAHDGCVAAVGRLVGAADAPYVIPGTGTTCLDATVMNLFTPGQRVVVPRTGFFGTRLVELGQIHRLEVVEVPVEIGRAVDPQAIAAAIDGAAGVLVTHVDTSTGVRHPVREIAEITREHGALLMVDGIASIGGEEMDVDGWGIDALVTSTQKGLETPPGLGIIALGARGRAALDARTEPVPSWYLDLKRWDWYRREWGWHPHPVTMPSNLVLALYSSVRRMLDVGMTEWIARRARLAASLRAGLVDLGFDPVPGEDVQSNMVLAVHAEDPASIMRAVLDDGIQISGGLDPLAGRALRIGLMGRTATPEMVDRILDLIAKAKGVTRA